MLKKKYLEYLGLSEKEATVYLELLRSDVMSGIELSRETGIKKATVYVIIEQLIKRGLVKEVKVGKRIHFHAETPDKFREMYEKERIEIETKLENVNNIISELKAIDRRVGERPVVKHYEGRQAMLDDIKHLTSEDGYSEKMDYAVYSYDLMSDIFKPRTLTQISQKQIEDNIKFRALYTGPKHHFEGNKEQELIKIDQDQFPIEANIMIYNDEVRFHTLGKDLFGISIKNKEIATTLKSMLNYIFSSRK